jgi:hypothetical protein
MTGISKTWYHTSLEYLRSEISRRGVLKWTPCGPSGSCEPLSLDLATKILYCEFNLTNSSEIAMSAGQDGAYAVS